jgi:hypothetical protein
MKLYLLILFFNCKFWPKLFHKIDPRAELLSSIFFLGSLLLYQRSVRADCPLKRLSCYALCFVTVALAVFSKEQVDFINPSRPLINVFRSRCLYFYHHRVEIIM